MPSIYWNGGKEWNGEYCEEGGEGWRACRKKWMVPQSATEYRVTLVVADLGWVDFDSDVPSSCPAAQPVLPNPHWPQQNRADIGTSKYKSTQPRSATTSVTL